MTALLNIDSVEKIINLEQQKGYTDKAVFGGLDNFFKLWSNQIINSITDPWVLSNFHKLKLVNSNYASLNIQQRKKWLKEVHDILAEMQVKETVRTDDKQCPVVNKLPSRARILKPIIATQGSIDSPITIIKGISLSLAAKFAKLGVKTVRDLLYLFPNRHLDYSQRKFISQLAEGEEETVVANVWQVQEIRLGGRRSTEAIVGDETGNVRAVWFNNPYMAKNLSVNKQVVLSGRITIFNGRPVFESPEWELVEDKELIHTGRLVPIYPLTKGLRPRQVRKLMKEVVDQWARQIKEFLPPE
ncbi:MAG: DNA helicase RecG, partial [Dehalococcoidales bacterium]|nr:DNA helicase RecG [Dehalococcoidales bacterium]